MRLIKKVKSSLNPPWDSAKSKTKLNILTTFDNFKPHGNQNYKTFIPLVIKNINETIPAISKIVELSNQNEIPTYSQYYENNKNKNSEEILQKLEKNDENNYCLQ